MAEDPGAAAREPVCVSRRVLRTGPVGSYGVCEVRFPGGYVATLDLLEHPGAAAVVPLLAGGDIVLLRQYRFAAHGYIWEIPAGKLDPGEAPEACAARELSEETGYVAGRLTRVGAVLTAPGFTDELIHLFCAEALSPGAHARERDELIEVHRMPLARAWDMVQSGEIVDAKTIAGLVHARRLAGATP
jgi:ADP-ribose pyrophosphatase